MTITIPTLIASLVTAAVWLRALTIPSEGGGGYFPDMAPLFYCGLAMIATLAVWLLRASASIWLGV